MSSVERGFALMTVLVILSAVSLLGMVAMERASLSSSLGKVVESSYQRDSKMRNLVASVVSSGLSVGFVDTCVGGVCGRRCSGVPRVWTAEAVVANGVSAGACATVSEHLGSEGQVGFWRVAAVCDGSVVVADVSVASNGMTSLEWGSP